ncbi:hypothetical protein WJX72_009263 [[Myrmecia] bisecta]|uniref:Uncharacterized protein n=1 Tax=[Myrmecia] bisecta TaxID=41462 RepID=A0AAW1R904_9CHLO
MTFAQSLELAGKQAPFLGVFFGALGAAWWAGARYGAQERFSTRRALAAPEERRALDERSVLAVEAAGGHHEQRARYRGRAGCSLCAAAIMSVRAHHHKALCVVEGRLLEELHKVCEAAAALLPADIL